MSAKPSTPRGAISSSIFEAGVSQYIKSRQTLAHEGEGDHKLIAAVQTYLSEIRHGGIEAIRTLSAKFDNWSPASFRLSKQQIDSCLQALPAQTLSDIDFAQAQVRNFAQHQRAALRDIEVETLPGVILGHKNIPVANVGCYVPGGQYPLVASAHMGVVTARVAGVSHVAVVTPPFEGRPNPAVVAAAHLAGADEIFCIGGVQAVAALAYGFDEFPAVDMIVGPGNAYVAEAKRQLFGTVGIDLIAGPTETLLIADDSVDGELCAVDLLGQAEHGPNSPATLITDSQRLGHDTLEHITRLLKVLPTAPIAGKAWEDYGQIILCDSAEQMAREADRLAAEHVQVMTRDPEYFLQRLSNYGALFLGSRTNVAYGDKVIGTNHTLPTRRAARYTGGLWVGKFLKTCTYQRILTDEAAVTVGEYCSRLSALEGFAGHAEQANIRLRRLAGMNIPMGGAAQRSHPG
jgi:sulfopropanediol 3-dehydrogenase